MKLASFDALVSALHQAGVRYLIAGGLAVNAHGYLRFTGDVDVVVQLVPDNIARAFAVLDGLGYRPLVPVTAAQFADAPTRQGWIRDKGMQVLQFWSDTHRETPVALIRMKQAADRPQDRIDIEYLRKRIEDGGAS